MQYTQYQFVKYAIYATCAKRFIRTAVHLQKCHTAHARHSHEALSHAKWVSFVLRFCENAGWGRGGGVRF